MSELNIVIVEDDVRACSAFSAYAETLPDIHILGVTANTGEAVKMISATRPHAVILDLELNDGDGSGLDVLRGVKDACLGYSPFFLITTVTTNQVLHNEVRSLGGAFVLAKHMPSYSEVYAIDFLRKMSGSILRGAGEDCLSAEAEDQQKQLIHQRLIGEMNTLGIVAKMKGHFYVIEYIEHLLEGKEGKASVAIGKRYNRTAASVEQAIKYAIETAWQSTDVEVLCKHFKARVRSDTGVPTPTEFIYYYVEMIKNEFDL